MTLPSAIEAVAMEAQLPPGMAGPEAVTLDVRCFVVPAPSGIVLIDTGLPGSSAAIEATLERVGAAWSDLTDIVLTHAHFDHFGGMAAIAARASQATLWAGALDVAAIPIDDGALVKELHEGDRIGGLVVLETPGHTPGHISLMDEASSLVIVGDLVGSVGGALSFGPPAFTADAARSRTSLERVVRMGVDRLLFSHGPEVPDAGALAMDLLGSSE